MNLKERVAVKVPGSKSIAIRTLIIATFFDTPLIIKNLPGCNDVLTVVNFLQQLGFQFIRDAGQVTVIPPEKITESPIEAEIKDSAAALRFLAVRLAVWEGFEGIIRLSPQLLKRPQKPLIDLITAMGGDIRQEDNRLIICGRNGLKFDGVMTESLSPEITSQLVSAVLLSSPVIETDTSLQEIRTVSPSYVLLTLKTMELFGLRISKGRRYVNPKIFEIEPDFSSACYFWALGCILKRLAGVYCSIQESYQPDYMFPALLEQMGAKVIRADGAIYVTAGELRGGSFDMGDMPDQVPTLAVLGLFTGVSIYNIEQLRYKESDRIAALVVELRKTGAEIEYRNGVMTVKKLPEGRITSAVLDSRNDHRLVMAFSLLQAVNPEIEISGKAAVNKSFPGFFRQLKKIVT